MPGWYPDPTGDSELFRYWDGKQWTAQTTDDPVSALGKGTGLRGRPGGRTVGMWLIVILSIVILVSLIAWLVSSPGNNRFEAVPEDTNSAPPTESGWDETSTSTPPPTEAGLVTCPYTNVNENTEQKDNKRLYGGGISVEKIDGWATRGIFLQWVSDMHSQTDDVAPGWISNISVGRLSEEDGFDNPQVAARQTLECFASSGYYLGFSGRTDLVDEATEIDGYYAWHIRSEVRIEAGYLPNIDGDVVDIYVIDVGDRSHMGLFVSSVTIGDTERRAKVDAAIATLRVE